MLFVMPALDWCFNLRVEVLIKELCYASFNKLVCFVFLLSVHFFPLSFCLLFVLLILFSFLVFELQLFASMQTRMTPPTASINTIAMVNIANELIMLAPQLKCLSDSAACFPSILHLSCLVLS